MKNVLLHLTSNKNNKYEFEACYFSISYPCMSYDIFSYFKF